MVILTSKEKMKLIFNLLLLLYIVASSHLQRFWGYIYDLVFSSLWEHSPFVRNGLPLIVRDESKTQFFLYKRLALRTDVNK